MPLNRHRMEHVVGRMGKSRILILGDIMLDEYLLGSVDRISPEAPVPVVEVTSNRTLLGGAANVTANIQALGDEPILVGAVGQDEAATKLKKLLIAQGVSCDHMVADSSRPTTIKTRIIAHGQQVVRFDQESRAHLSESIQNTMLDIVKSQMDNIGAVIVSDYGKGVITTSLLNQVTELCNTRGIFIAVDPKETNFHTYRRVSLITPNHHEAGFAYGRKIQSLEDLDEVGNGLLAKLEARSLLITRGPEGMSLYSTEEAPTHIPTFARQVFDVTGAGDTVIATFVSAICAGASLSEAAVFANAGAGCTVGEIGTATVTVSQLEKEVARNINNGTLKTAQSRS